MDNLIERYVYDVTRRLPDKDRNEVSKELKANIYDMLPENPDENEMKTVLYKLGTPASLAERYRQKPRYLISPAIYDDYVRALEWILPLVGSMLFVIGMILGGIHAIKDGIVDARYFIKSVLSMGFSLGVSATFQALVWTTVGFVIAERADSKSSGRKEKEWKVEDLPDVLPSDKNAIQLSDSIAELVLTVVGSVLVILLCLGKLPVAFIIQDGNTQIRTLLSSQFLASCIPAIVVMALLNICVCIIKIKQPRWTPLVCGALITCRLINTGIMVYLITRPALLSSDLSAFLEGVDWSNAVLSLSFLHGGGIKPIIMLICVVIAACSLAECVHAVYKTLKIRRQQ